MKRIYIQFDPGKMAVDAAQKGLTTAALAAAAGLSVRVVQYYLRGQYATTATNTALATALGFSPARYVVGVRKAKR